MKFITYMTSQSNECINPDMTNLSLARARLAVDNDIDEVLSLIHDLSRWLKSKGIHQWSDSFPRKTLELELLRRELFVLDDEKGIIASVALSMEAGELWDDISENAVHLHRLAVARTRAGEKLGEAVMTWAEAEVKRKGINLLRLVCDESNPFLPAYYKNLGYKSKGTKIYEPWKMKFVRFEKEL
jgi:predicted N-acetyltransferase YhbS